MEHQITPPTDSTDTDSHPPIGIDHPTVQVEVMEEVKPDYDILIANDPLGEFSSADRTKIARLEQIVLADDVDKLDIREAVHNGVTAFHDEYATPDDFNPILERVYLRTVANEDAVCVHLRSEYEHRVDLSRLLLSIDEALRPVIQPRD